MVNIILKFYTLAVMLIMFHSNIVVMKLGRNS